MAIPEFMRGGEVGSSTKITQNPFAAEITSSATVGENGVQVALAPNPVTQGPVPSVVDTAVGGPSPIRGIPAQLEHDGPVPSVVDTSTGGATTGPAGTFPGSMRPPSTVDTSRNR